MLTILAILVASVHFFREGALMALNPQTFDAPLLSMNEQEPTVAAPAGRLTRINNAVAKKFTRTQGGTVLRVEKRDGFGLLPTTVRDPATGAVSGKSIAGATMLASYSKQLVLAAAGALFVLSETAGCWESPLDICPTETLRAKVVDTQSAISSLPDSARIGARTMYVWFDTFSVKSMILDDDGTAIQVPTVISSPTPRSVKAVSDGTQFWIVVSDTTIGVIAQAVSAAGAALGSATAAGHASGYLDVVPHPTLANRIVVVQTAPAAAPVQLVTFTWNGSTVSAAAASVTGTLASSGRVGIIKNDTGDTNLYVGAIDGAGPFDYRVYQVTTVGPAVTHTYTITTAQAAAPMEITGFVRATGNKDVTVLLSFVDATFTQLNFTDCWTVTFAGVSTKQATKRSLTMASRPFVLNGLYYAVAYYQCFPDVTPFSNNVQQSTFFLVNIDFGGTFQVCGRWEFGTAYADWQRPSSSSSFLHLSTPTLAPDGGVHLALSYRATSFTTRAVIGNSAGQQWANQPTNTVGIKDFSFGPDSGTAVEASGVLLIPGPQATAFLGTGVVEHGIPTISEILQAPTLGGGGSLTTNVTYQYVVIPEWTDNSGNRVRGPATPPYNVIMGGNTKVTISGTMVHTTQKKNLTFGVYRSVFIGGAMSVEHRKITNDLAPILNDDTQTSWTLIDTLSDAAAAVGETAYVDKDLTDRFPCPPFSSGCTGADRVFVIGYDRAVWFSGQRTEGDAWWFSPFQRITLPTLAEPKAVAVLDNLLVIFDAQDSVFTVPIAQLPDATGVGIIPTPTKLPLSHGCTGFAEVYSDGVMFSSTQGGIWTLTRSLDDVFSGAPVSDDTAASFVVAMATDANQRVGVMLNDGTTCVYDGVSGCWYTWTLGGGRFLTTHKGLFAMADGLVVRRQTPGIFQDVDNGGTHAIATDVQAVFHLGDVRGFKRVWGMQIVGQWRGAHALVVSGYLDDDTSTVVETWTFTPGASTPYVYELPPKIELCSSRTLRFQDQFPGGPSAGFALEMVSFYLGMERGLGRLAPSTRRIAPT